MQRLQPLDHAVLLSYPKWIAPSEWIEHVPFAMLLVDLLRPATIVELGAHYGVSYCAFCQAVSELQLSTLCYAVDTWQGDPHDGYYGADVLAALKSHHDPLYGSFSRLIQSTFDAAVTYFADGSIDLLHIDGYHTYEAVRHDFETWLPRLSSRAVVLFHDINVRERDFGVWRFWEEIREAYPSFEFTHCHGLGVLAVGPEAPGAVTDMLGATPDDAQQIRRLCYQLGLRLRARQLHDRAVADFTERIDTLSARLAKAEQDVATLEGWVRERDAMIRKLDGDASLYQGWIAERDALMRRLNEQLGTRVREYDGLSAVYTNLEAAQAQLKSRLDNAEGDVATLHEWVHERDELIRRLWRDKEELLAEQATLDEVRRSLGGRVLLPYLGLRRRAAGLVGRARRGVQLVRRGVAVQRTQGSRELVRRAIAWQRRRAARPAAGAPPAPASPDEQQLYEQWIAATEPDMAALAAQAEAARLLPARPLLSVLTPVYNPPPAVLEAMIQSVLSQTYDHWELLLINGSPENAAVCAVLERAAGDARVNVVELERNQGIVGNTNAGLAAAAGEYVAFVDHDDTLAPFALFEVARLLGEHPETDMVYSDNDLLSPDGTRRFQPLFKPDWSPAIMLSANYATHLCVVRTALLRELGGLTPGMDGAQDWDLILRVGERTGAIAHIPQILYHWRDSDHSTAVDITRKPYVTERQAAVITAHLRRAGVEGRAFFDASGFLRVDWPLSGATRVSILIPSRDPKLVAQCIGSLRARTAYKNYELIVVDSSPGHVIAAEWSRDAGVRVLPWEGPFNYAAVNNLAASAATGAALLFLNDDTEMIDPQWLGELVRWAERDTVGVVGPKLLYPDGSIQHAGVVVGLDGFAGHPFLGLREGGVTFYGRSEWYRNYSAVTGACLMIRRELFERVGGFDQQLALCGNDVALCLRVRALGYEVLYTPFARLVHHESVSRKGKPIPDGDFARSYQYYVPLLRDGDPYYSPNLSPWSTRPLPRLPDEQAPLTFVYDYLVRLGLEPAQLEAETSTPNETARETS